MSASGSTCILVNNTSDHLTRCCSRAHNHQPASNLVVPITSCETPLIALYRNAMVDSARAARSTAPGSHPRLKSRSRPVKTPLPVLEARTSADTQHSRAGNLIARPNQMTMMNHGQRRTWMAGDCSKWHSGSNQSCRVRRPPLLDNSRILVHPNCRLIWVIGHLRPAAMDRNTFQRRIIIKARTE